MAKTSPVPPPRWYAGLSTKAMLTYWALRYWRETRRERAWSRRDIHRRLRGKGGARRVAALDAQLAALVAAGLLRPCAPAGCDEQHGPWFALVARPREPGPRSRPPVAG